MRGQVGNAFAVAAIVSAYGKQVVNKFIQLPASKKFLIAERRKETVEIDNARQG